MNVEQLRAAAHDRNLHVAIDGPAAGGKSSVGRGVAQALRAPYLDTGLMYRAVTWLAIMAGVPTGDELGLARIARDTDFESPVGSSALLVNGVPRDRELRSAAVDAVVSEVSAHPLVRQELVAKQQAFARGHAAVLVGRDIGTTVLPDAPVKLWVTASPAERARRRLREGLGGSDGIGLEEMTRRIRSRDALDASRTVSPSRPALDALTLDTERLDEPAAVEAALHIIDARLGAGSAEAAR